MMKKTLSYLFATLVFNTAIAAVLAMLRPEFGLWHFFVYSQCIGLSVLLVSFSLFAKMPGGIKRVAVLALSLPFSVAIGLSLAFAITGFGSWSDPLAWQPMVTGLFFGLIGAIALILAERVEAEVKQRQLVKSESERRAVEAHLKLLQAQIEPHFLFNTLANAGSLIDGDPALAKRLLERLNDWLRVALARARSDSATLGDELDMLENYLQIMKIRFGERLNWHIQVPEYARLSAFPPMLLQPLVENAVRHGIEPKLGGGEIGIRAHIGNASLRIEVSDSGVGLQDKNGAGAGLANVRARLAILFGEAGRLTLRGNGEGGATATLELPQ
ncbi:MAG: histidine kinase [Sulfurimicrobium sp.]|nr:histidine kinase [Sulfurimicrobium sp.]MDP2200304.1 histidine kinase [Sulfurimicrobium sp.]MDP3688340.1 histidine kinase [Sulfurimicrobium sp.]